MTSYQNDIISLIVHHTGNAVLQESLHIRHIILLTRISKDFNLDYSHILDITENTQQNRAFQNVKVI